MDSMEPALLDPEMMCIRVTKEFKDGDCVNLGFGIPVLCSSFVPSDKTIFLYSESGVISYGRQLSNDELDLASYDLIDAQGYFVTPEAGMVFTSLEFTMSIPRGGHVDITVLGGLQVGENGDLANWTVRTDRPEFNIGGAMDMAQGSKRVIVCMEHTTKDGKPKIVKNCTYPLTGSRCVDLIVTDIAVIKVVKEGLLLKEFAPGWTVDMIQRLTEPKLIIAEDLKEIAF